MRLEKQFDVDQPAEVALRIATRDETLLNLFPGSTTEIVESAANQRTTRTHYTVMGNSGIATFRFVFLPEGSISFEKVCDGKIWEELSGTVSFHKQDDGTRVTLQMTGRTKAFVPEITIRGPMQNRIEQMAAALRTSIEAG